MNATPNSAAPLDLAVMREHAGGDGERLNEYLAEFQQLAAVALQELMVACAQSRVTALSSAAHRVKVSARMAGARTLGDLSESLEQAGQAGQLDEARRLLLDWESEWLRVDAFLLQRLAGLPGE